MTGLTAREKDMALNLASNGADFMFIPSDTLCNMLASGSSETIDVNEIMVAILLTRKPIRLDTATVVKYCRGSLDRRNTWLLDHGDLKVVPHQFKRPELVKPKEDDPWDENNSEKEVFYNDLEDIEYD